MSQFEQFYRTDVILKLRYAVYEMHYQTEDVIKYYLEENRKLEERQAGIKRIFRTNQDIQRDLYDLQT